MSSFSVYAQYLLTELTVYFFVPQELKESFNYGLFSPPENGRAGKFLDEERRLGDYPFNGPVGYLEVSTTESTVFLFYFWVFETRVVM